MPEEQSAKNKLGLWTTTSLVAGNMIGAGVFLMPATLAMYGSIGILGWAFSSVGGFLLAKVFSNLSKLLPHIDGGPYAYTRSGFGDFAGFLVAWCYWISIWASNGALAVAFVSAMSTFIPLLGYSPVAAMLTGLGTIWLLTWVNTRSIIATGKLQLVTTILKLVPLVFVSIAGLFFIHINNFKPFNISGQSTFAAITAAGTLTFFSFLGVECATIPAGNVANPEKTIPRATMLGTIITTVVYVLCTVSVMGMIPAIKLQHSVTPLADAGVIIAGSNAKYFVSAGVAMAAFGALNGWILIQGQIPFAIAKDKLFPPVFKKENKKGMPATGIIIGSVLASLLMMMNYTKGLVEQFKFLILLSTLTSLVPYLFCAASYVIVSAAKVKLPATKWAQTITIAFLSFAFSLWAITGSGQEIVYWGFLLLMAGIPFYVWLVAKKDSNNS